MKIKCLYNTGKALRIYEDKQLKSYELGRFGATENTQFNEIEIGKEYLVMGMILFKSYAAYLIDDGIISACPCQLFQIIDDKINADWHFRLVRENEDIYPYIQAIFGYYELCFDEKSYEKLIVDKDDDATNLYFRRKKQVESKI